MVNNLNWIFNVTLLDIVKWLLIGGLVLYTAFAAIIIRQVMVMSEAIEDPFNLLVQMFAWVHLLLAIFLVAAAMVML